jgi:nicotinamidase-related amidase
MKTALLLIDIQNDYFEGGTMQLSGSDKASLNAKVLLEKFRNEHLPVIHVQHIADRPNATFFLPETNGAEIHENVKPLPSEKIIKKQTPNSFKKTELQEYLQENEITDLVICGMMTHMCVDATTRAAKDLGYSCVLISDACATKDLDIYGEKVKAEDIQKSFLAALNYFYSTVMTTRQYMVKN